MSVLLIFFCNIFFLSISSYQDIKKRIIPNRCVLCMLAAFFAVNAGTVLSGGSSPLMMTLIKWAVCPFFVILFFLPAEILSGKSLGCGDKKMLMVLSLSLGFWGSVFLIFGMLTGAAFCYATLRYIKKKTEIMNYKITDPTVDRGMALPMAPFILAAYFIVFFLKLT